MRRRILILSQVYVPDPASVGQHLHDVAVELVRRGYRVRVVTSSRGYDDPSRRYPPRESIDGVEVLRVPALGLGKQSLICRLLAQLFFLAGAFFRGLATRGLATLLISTSPPMCSLIGLAIATIRRRPLVYWVMDINPDQAVATGVLSPKSVLVHLLEGLNRLAMKRSDVLVTLDRFMASRLGRKTRISDKLFILPPWPHEQHLSSIPHEENPFRRNLGVEGKVVFMYSGNHAVTSPISTILQAAQRLKDRRDIVFVFVGGGVRKPEVDKTILDGATNVMSLPYQPLDALSYSLSAADVHLVTLDPRGVGIVHPCKMYGAMAIGRPILFIGPEPCHISEILDQHHIGRRVEEGDIAGAVQAVRAMADMSRHERASMGRTAKEVVRSHFSMDVLCPTFVDILERALVEGGAGNTAVAGEPLSERPYTRV